MKNPQHGFSTTSFVSPGKQNVLLFARLAFWTASTCCATTDRTGSKIRLNSSKQPQRPAWDRPVKIFAQSVWCIWSVQSAGRATS
eukprot:scaffold57_cov254-Pinguiococcus_pyrenoidosus.AAC.42